MGVGIIVWNGESRLIRMTATPVAVAAGHVRLQLEFVYDWQGWRLQKLVKEDSDEDGTVYEMVLEDRRFVYDGWKLVAEYQVNGTTWSLRNTYLWGLDLSGTEQGAGGVGGLLLDVDQSGGSAVERFPA
ncbi:MAG: hypothetical protein AAGC74_06970 [Verrucomicrobiota bacterium]